MKSTNLPKAQWILTLLGILIAFSGFSQKSITWKGGTPGMKNDWYCPQNWSTTSLPDEFSDVIIPDVSTSTLAFPEIKSGEIEINSLMMHSNTLLMIGEDATLMVTGNIEGLTAAKLPGAGRLLRVESTLSVVTEYMADKSH
ncbi:MAG: hypothetical protein KBA14_07890 [Saprospiraceae bacterium]|nr:hypothetical protein [Saprospiraceae bacterium]